MMKLDKGMTLGKKAVGLKPSGIRKFFDIVADYERRFHEAEERSILPDSPDMEAVAAFVESVNRRVVTREIG